MLVSLMVDEFLAERAVKLGPLARRQYASELGRLVGWLTEQGITDTSALTLPVLVSYMAWLRDVPGCWGKVRASKTLSTYYKTVRCLCRWAVDAEYLPQRVLRLPAPRVERKLPATLSQLDALKLVKAAGSGSTGAMQARDTAIALCLLDTGMRASELCGLALDDVKLDEGYILVKHGKGSKWRTVGPLGSRTVRALRAYRNTWRPKQRPTCDAFFISRSHGPMGRNTLGQITTRLKVRAGAETGNPHSFRHSYAASLARAGVPTLAISRMLGHSNLAITSTYLQSFDSRDAMKLVTSVVDGL